MLPMHSHSTRAALLGLLTLLHSTSSLHAAATAIVRRTAGGGAGQSMLYLRVAESLRCHQVVILTANLPLAKRGAMEWKWWSSEEWQIDVVSRGAAQLAPLPLHGRQVIFCSFESAAELAVSLSSSPCDLLVCDTSGVRAKKMVQRLRLAAHEGFLPHRRRLVVSLDDGPSTSLLEPPPMQPPSNKVSDDDTCVISALGRTCIEPTPTSIVPWYGPICRRIVPTHGASRLAITAHDAGLLILTLPEVQTALRRHLPDAQSVDDDRHSKLAPHLTELALAVVYAYCVVVAASGDE